MAGTADLPTPTRELDLSLEQAGDPGLKHYFCVRRYRDERGRRVAVCGVNLDGAHICPADLSCGCTICPECAATSGADCPVLGGRCVCSEEWP